EFDARCLVGRRSFLDGIAQIPANRKPAAKNREHRRQQRQPTRCRVQANIDDGWGTLARHNGGANQESPFDEDEIVGKGCSPIFSIVMAMRFNSIFCASHSRKISLIRSSESFGLEIRTCWMLCCVTIL